MTQLLVINCETEEIKAFDGRVLVDKFQIPDDMDLTQEEKMESLEWARQSSTVQSRDARRQLELMEQQVLEARRWRHKNEVEVSFKPWKPVVQ